ESGPKSAASVGNEPQCPLPVAYIQQTRPDKLTVPPHKRGSSEPEGCVRCSPAATRGHAAMARLAVVPAPGSWPLENGASPPWRCAAPETWRTNGAAARALLHRD